MGDKIHPSTQEPEFPCSIKIPVGIINILLDDNEDFENLNAKIRPSGSQSIWAKYHCAQRYSVLTSGLKKIMRKENRTYFMYILVDIPAVFLSWHFQGGLNIHYCWFLSFLLQEYRMA